MPKAPEASILKATLHRDADVELRLLHYPAMSMQSRHRHEASQLSVLLVGSFRESTSGMDVEAMRRSSGVKPCGQSHAVEFGPHGALMLSMTMTRDPITARAAGEWRANCATLDRLIAGLLN